MLDCVLVFFHGLFYLFSCHVYLYRLFIACLSVTPSPLYFCLHYPVGESVDAWISVHHFGAISTVQFTVKII